MGFLSAIRRLVGRETQAEEQEPVVTGPIEMLPMPQFSLARPAPFKDLAVTREYRQYVDTFAQSPSSSRAEVSAAALAILYALTRKLRPARAVVFAADRLATAEAFARAVLANQFGTIEAVEPHARGSASVVAGWPEELRAHLAGGALDVKRFIRANHGKRDIGIAFVGGTGGEAVLGHVLDACGGRLEPGGVIAVNGISRKEIADAVARFMAKQADWRILGGAIGADRAEPVSDTDLVVLMAPV